MNTHLRLCLPANWLLWLARLASLGSLLILSAFLVGGGFPLSQLASREGPLFLCFPLGIMLGLAWGWRQPAVGGIVTLASLHGFYALHLAGRGRLPSGPWFVIFASPGLPFLIAQSLARRPPQTP